MVGAVSGAAVVAGADPGPPCPGTVAAALVGARRHPRRPRAVALVLLCPAGGRDAARHGGRPASPEAGATVRGPGGGSRTRGVAGLDPVLGPDRLAPTPRRAVGPPADE